MKVTLITTVKNEEKTIIHFLDSVAKQTKKPDEIIIVDAKSTDDTVSLIKKHKRVTKLIIKKGNRSIGRNCAIRASSNEYIVVSDAGCILDKNWLKKITDSFKNQNVDVVAGFYKPLVYSVFESCLATYTCTMSDKLDQANFLPSSRSIAFKKSAWKNVKGYPENLNTCEDLVFAKKLKNSGNRFKTVRNAIVYWPQRKNILQAAKQFYAYAQGDGQARYFRKTTPLLFARYIFGITVLIYAIVTSNYFLLTICYALIFLYFLWSIQKNYKYVNHWKAIIYLPLLQIVSDAAVLSGTIIGLGRSLWDTQNKR